MAIVASLVCFPRITSTSGICRTGLKKCSPQNRSGCSSPAASCVIGIVDVFEQRIVSSFNSGSSRANRCCLASGFSMIASTMMSECDSSTSESVPLTSGASSTARFTSGPLSLLVVRDFVQHALNAAGERRLVGIHQRDRDAALDIRRRDALPHHAGADDAGRRDFSRRHVALDTARFLVAIAQEEHVEQCPVDRRAEQLWKLLGLHLAGRVDVDAGRAEHQLRAPRAAPGSGPWFVAGCRRSPLRRESRARFR